MNKYSKYLLILGVAALSFGNAKAQQADSIDCASTTPPAGYPKANVTYFTEEECYAQNPNRCVTCYQTRSGIWWALAKFPTMIDSVQKRINTYFSLEELKAINGLDTPYVRLGGNVYAVPDPRRGRGAAGLPRDHNEEFSRELARPWMECKLQQDTLRTR